MYYFLNVCKDTLNVWYMQYLYLNLVKDLLIYVAIVTLIIKTIINMTEL